MSEKLIPPDKKRCQAEVKYLDPFAFGITPPKRCESIPIVIVKENGLEGSMSLCGKCFKVCKKQIKNVEIVESLNWKKRGRTKSRAKGVGR